jgi:hypothetical protein
MGAENKFIPVLEKKLQNWIYLSSECIDEEGVQSSDTSGGVEIIIVGRHP